MRRRRETQRGYGRFRLAARAVATAATLLVLVASGMAVATPAHAGEDCTDIGIGVLCGGVGNEQDRVVAIAFKWCGDEATGTACPTSDPEQEIVLLPAGSRTSPSVDWDAFRVDAGCTYTGTTETVGLPTASWSFSGGNSGLWVKVNDVQDVTIRTTACGALQDRPSYRIKNVNSQLCLVARNGAGENPVVQSTCGNFVDQRWYVDKVGTFSRLRNYNSNKCVATRGYVESAAVATTCGEWADQLWIQENAGGVQRFRNVNSGLCLVTRGTGESRAVQSVCGDWNDQKWFRPAW